MKNYTGVDAKHFTYSTKVMCNFFLILLTFHFALWNVLYKLNTWCFFPPILVELLVGHCCRKPKFHTWNVICMIPLVKYEHKNNYREHHSHSIQVQSWEWDMCIYITFVLRCLTCVVSYRQKQIEKIKKSTCS